MKQFKLTILLTMLMSMVGARTLAHDFAVANADGKTIYYKKTSDTEVAVTYQGSYYSDYSNEYTGDVVIPMSVWYNGTTYSVTSIGHDAFNNCKNLTSVTIPNSVKNIQYFAFDGCTGLSSITIPSSVTFIDNTAFSECSGLTSIKVDTGNTIYDSRNNCNAIIKTEPNQLVIGCQNTVIPEGTISIGNNAFNGIRSLTSIIIPNTVTSINSCAFIDCINLTSITIGSGVKTIEAQAFSGCSGLASVTIPNSVTSIGSSAFYSCNSLTSVTVERAVPVSIYEFTFSNRTNATLYVPKGSKAAYEAADYWKEFKEIVELPAPSNNITFADANVKAICVANWDTNSDGELSEEEAAAVTDIGSLFKGNTSITSFDELQYFTGLTSIGNGAFSGCSSLVSISIPSSLINIDSNAFGCSNLSAVNITSLEAWCSITFGNASSNPLYFAHHLYLNGSEIKDLVIPNSVNLLNSYSFCGGYFLSVFIPSSTKMFNSGESIFRYAHIESININWYIPRSCFTDAVIGSVVINNENANSAGRYAFYKATIDEVNIPYSETAFTYDSDRDYYGIWGECTIKKVTVDRNIKDTNYYNSAKGTFYNCKIDTMIIGPNAINYANERLYHGCEINELFFNGLTEINTNTYYNNGSSYKTKIKYLHLSDGLTTIKENAFNNTDGNYCVKNHLTLPQSLVSVGSKGLYAFANYISVSCFANTPPSIEDNTFTEDTYKNTLYVPIGSKTSYANAKGWKKFSDIVEIPNKDQSITFADINVKNTCINLWDIDGDGELTYNEAALVKSLKGFCNIGTYDEYASLYTSFEELEHFTSLEEIPYRLFGQCSNLTSIRIPKNIKEIGGEAFYGCINLSSILIPINVTTIGDCAFQYCSGLTSVTVMQTTPIEITENTFGYRANATLYVPKGSKSAYEAADYWKEFKEIVELPDGKLFFEGTTVRCGSQSAIPVLFESEAAYGGLQCEVTLPAGITLNKVSKTARLSDAFTLTKSLTGDNTYQILLYNTERATFAGNDGALFTMTIDVADNMAVGNYDVTLSNIVVSDVDNNQTDLRDCNVVLRVENYLLGDANRDNRVNVTDIMAVANKILKYDVQNFNEHAADVNFDNRINVTDIMGIANIILKINTAAHAPAVQLPEPQ